MAAVFACGCSAKASYGTNTNSNAVRMTGGAPAGVEGQNPPVFRDMSNLYGRMTPEGTAWAGTGYIPELPAAVSSARQVPAGESEALPSDFSQRKLVKRAYLRVRVDDLDAADSSVNALMEQYDAYSSSTESGDNYRNYVIRVASSSYAAFLSGLDGMGRTLHYSESTEDVSLRYYDLEGRLATREELLKTFRSYLEKAKNIEEILSVEARIADLQNDIDKTGRDLRGLADLVDYSTISLEVLGPVASVSYRGSTLAERVRELFSGLGKFLSMVIIVLIGIVIYGIPTVLLLVVLFWLLFGRLGLIRKLFRIAAGKKSGQKSEGGKSAP